MPVRPATGRVAIRVSAGTELGMGHLVRCTHLAKAMLERGVQPFFLVDQYIEALKPWLKPFQVMSVYEHTHFREQREDALCCLASLTDGDWLIVDDYRLSEEWETLVRRKAARVIVIDDLANRKHFCEVLIDYRWCEGNQQHARYRNLVPKHCQQLLGPAYCLLAPEYKESREYQQRGERKATNTPFVVLLSLGGGGDTHLLANLLQTLVVETSESEFEFWPVIGALTSQPTALNALEKQYSNIKPIRGQSNLAEFYRKADLFIGAAGTSIYEINATDLPSITFSMADNQNNTSADLEQLGVYLHLTHKEFTNGQAMARLLVVIKEHYQRVCHLLAQRQVRVDGKGTTRVLACLLGDELIEDSGVASGGEQARKAPVYRQELKPNIYIRQIDDTEINRYLDVRNLELNRKRMSVIEEIARSEHYAWWFTHSRDIFVLRHNNKNILYIWHQHESFEGKGYLIGGWMVASEACGFDMTALALSWQLQYCEQRFPQATWVAIINKENRFVNLLNSLYGFEAVQAQTKESRAIEHFFPKANRQHFNYVACRPSSVTHEMVAL